MPRRRYSGSPSSRTTLPARPTPSLPAHPPQAQPKQPGLMGQMAATAGGVAAGHVMGSAIMGALSGGNNESAAARQGVDTSNVQQGNPCQFQIDELIRCTQLQHDITFCTGFSEALKECSKAYGLYPGQH
ncbi:unnamed protein product [Dicrocoelium dendriticum]|nr:unnamed protein product [Dicrocoelium dendriticum]